jgi:dTDP-4-amino-4,6-dideoxygalactose transaminase
LEDRVPQDGIPFLNLSLMHNEIRAEVDAALAEVVDDNAFIGGRWVDAFEAQFATYTDRNFCVGVANGTDALTLILRGLGVGPGDEVILPGNTFIATAEAVVLAGAVPVFADVEPDRLLMTAATIEPLITERTAACIVVHLFGQPADMDDIGRLTERVGIALIEDAAQAHGATWNGLKIGSFGVASAFSFYPGKNLGAFGDGGAVTTDDAALAETIRSLINHGRSQANRYMHDHVGVNSRLDGLQAAALAIKLRELDRWNEGRRSAHREYASHLAGSDLVCLADHPAAVPVHHLEVIRTTDRAVLQAALDANGIGHGIHYPVPCQLHPPYQQYANGDLPVVNGAAEQILSVPMFPHLEAAQVQRVCDVMLAVAATSLVDQQA